MSGYELQQKVEAILKQSPEQGRTSIPFMGGVAFYSRHRITSVSLPQTAAIVVLRGEKVLYHGRERLSVRDGGAFLLPARVEVNLENIPESGTSKYLALCLAFPQEMLARAAAAPQEALHSVPPFSLKSLEVKQSAPLSAGIAHLLDMAAARGGHERLLSLCLEQVLLLMLEKCECLPYILSAASSWSSRCASLLSVAPGRDWTIADVAGRLGASERNLRRNLQSEGESFRNLLQSVRLNAGLAMLQSRDFSVGEVAQMCGYSSASRFAGRFREKFGLSPSEMLRHKISGPILAESAQS